MTKIKQKDCEIIPAILEEKFCKIKKKIIQTKDDFETVQIDICDGIFTPAKTFLSSGSLKSFEKLKKFREENNKKDFSFLEIDLIAVLNEKNWKKWVSGLELLKPKRIIFHLNSVENWDKIFDFIENSVLKKTEIGLGIQIKHKCKKDVLPILEKYDFSFVQFMGIEKIGYGGQKLTSKVYRKIRKLKTINEKNIVSIDGGVKHYNAQKLYEAGVRRFVSGSGLFSADNLIERKKEFCDFD